jgi:hypothetical protein
MIALILAALSSAPTGWLTAQELNDCRARSERCPMARATSESPALPPARPFDPRRDALACVERDRDRALAAARAKVEAGEIVLLRPLGEHVSCVRCLARGKDGKPVELDPLVCDSFGMYGLNDPPERKE